MRVALVHDYLSQDGGAERVLSAMHEIWPEAPIFVLFHDQKKIIQFNNAKIHESFLAKLPFIKSAYQWYLPLMPLATEKHRLADFDVIISSTSAFAKGVITDPDTLHISYCHTPPRFLWASTHDYLSDLKSGRLLKPFLSSLVHKLRMWDHLSALRVDHFIANSKTVQKRIQKYYRRSSVVIHPPINLADFKITDKIEDYFVAGGRLVPYKNLDLAIKTFNRLGWPLKIFGTGSELKNLQKMAKPNITFLGKISEQEKIDLISKARAFIHPQEEDFGITPLEAMACGRPVIAFKEGGATETVVPGISGVFFEKQTWESLLDALVQFDHTAWNSALIREQVAKFDLPNFKTALSNYVNQRFEEFKNKNS